MSLDITAKHSDGISVSYSAFDRYRVAVVGAMDGHIGELYQAWCTVGLEGAAKGDCEAFDDWFAARPALGSLCAAPDCDFSFTPAECREIRKALLVGLPAGFSFRCADRGASGRGDEGGDGYVVAEMDLHARFMDMLGECARRRVKMYGR